MLFYYSLLEVFFFFHMLGNQFCYFRVLTTTSIFRGFQNYLPYLRKEAETQIDLPSSKLILGQVLLSISVFRTLRILDKRLWT